MPEKIHKLPSLRSRYLILAGMVTILLLLGASIANWYIRDVSNNSTAALSINKMITTTVSEIRNSLSRINISVNTMMIRPEASHEVIINNHLIHLQELLSSLRQNENIQLANLKQPLDQLNIHILHLNKIVRHLIEQRKDPQWVYPILPYISDRLLTPNRNFIAAIDQSLNEYLQEDLAIDETYHQLQQLRNLWQKKILNFRAVIVRFAGLNNTDKTPQETQIEILHQQISHLLSVLKQKQNNGLLGLQTEASVDVMQAASSDWQKNWLEVIKIRGSSYWRGDIAYMNEQVIPAEISTYAAMRNLEATTQTWSNTQTMRLSDAAKQISTELWILVLLAISFVIIVYIMIEKLVLQPTARISKSLSEEGQEQFFSLEDKSSKEIFRLTHAFNNMRKQIHQRQMALEHQAMHDALTGLPNRTLLNDRLSQAIHIMKRNGDKLAVLLLDLDRFKEVNDTLGHHIGDQLLQMVSKRLEATIRTSDTVARLGGDEFAVIAPNTSPEEAIQFSTKVINALKDVFTINHQNLFVGASLGISIYPDNGTDIHTLLRHADSAMYVAKAGNQDIVLYDVMHDKNTPDNLSLAGDLHNAIKQNDLTIFYQPQINLFNREVIQVEALLRWQHSAQGFIAPENIIQLAEQTGMIKELTYWVLNTAMMEYMQHLHQKQIGLSINLSAWNLQDPELVHTIDNLIKQHNMPANCLTLEITESAMMSDPVRAREVLLELHNRNIVLAIDDYGTGFSSLSYLKLLPVQELKIDKSFIFDMLDDDNDAIIVKSTIELAHNLGFKVIAEGVENHDTFLQLRTQKCDYIQGYYLSRPQNIYDFIIWLDNYQLQVAQ